MRSLPRATRDVVIVGVIALVVRIPAFGAPQPLGFDDGQFAMSVIAMRHGGLPFREVFSSQGPLFLPFAWLGDLLTFRTIDSPRAAAVAAGVVLSVLVLLVGRRLATPGAALLGAILVALSGSILWTTGPLTSDGIAEALTVGAVLAALRYWDRPGWRRAAVVGLLGGAALAVKSLLVIPGLAAVAFWVLLRRRPRDIAVVPIVAAAVVLLASVPWGLGRVYDQYVRYHTDAVAGRPIAANSHKLVTTLFERDLPLLAAAFVALVITVAILARSRPAAPDAPPDAGPRAPWWPVAVWFAVVVAVVLTESPMWRNHVAHVSVPLSLLVVVALGRDARAVRGVAVAAAVALLATPWSVIHLGELLRPQEPPARTAGLDRVLANLPDGGLVISDTPGVVWRAGRRAPDDFVDVSILRITSRTPSLRLTEDTIVHAARRPDVCAVVRWSSQRFQHFPTLGARLRAQGYETRLARPHHARLVWVKRDCRPGDRAGRTPAAAGTARSPG